MPEAVHNADQDYWHPPQPPRSAEPAMGLRAQLSCPECGTEYVVGSRFCHVCGHEREAMPGFSSHRWSELLDFTRICESTGLSVVALIALVAGVACIAAAIAVGFLFTASTVLDWQAVQVWRIEWLLAAVAAFLAGILLKKNDSR